MGKIQNIIHEEIIDEVPDRNCNLLRVYRAPNGEVTIHFRNVKIVLQTLKEQEEWKRGFAEALKKFEDNKYFGHDI